MLGAGKPRPVDDEMVFNFPGWHAVNNRNRSTAQPQHVKPSQRLTCDCQLAVARPNWSGTAYFVEPFKAVARHWIQLPRNTPPVRQARRQGPVLSMLDSKHRAVGALCHRTFEPRALCMKRLEAGAGGSACCDVGCPKPRVSSPPSPLDLLSDPAFFCCACGLTGISAPGTSIVVESSSLYPRRLHLVICTFFYVTASTSSHSCTFRALALAVGSADVLASLSDANFSNSRIRLPHMDFIE